MPSRTSTDLVRQLEIGNAVLTEKVTAQEKEAAAARTLGERVAVLETRLVELPKARETAGNRPSPIGVAILTAQFAPVTAVLAAVLRK